MRIDIAQRWTAELKSDKRKQGKLSLRAFNSSSPEGPDEYCCLGVLCEMAVEDGVIPEPGANCSTGEYLYGEWKEISFLPVEVMEWAGMQTTSGLVTVASEKFSLASLNDSGMHFSDIADKILENADVL